MESDALNKIKEYLNKVSINVKNLESKDLVEDREM